MSACKHTMWSVDKYAPPDTTVCVNCYESKEVIELRAEVRDLKARLRAAREALRISAGSVHCADTKCDVCVGRRALDLRVKNWRKP